MVDLAIVILHYNTIDNTFECVESIRHHLSGQNYHIIIVDNDSPNGSFRKLLKEYDDVKNITLIKNDSNLGFAKGNNVGYQYAKHELDARYIMMINNDTKLLQGDFISKIEDAFIQEKFYVMGPMILTRDGRYTSNPVRTALITRAQVDSIIHHYRKELLYLKLHMLWAQDAYHFVKGLFQKKKEDVIDHTIIHKNVELHGCCLIFSPLYIQKYEGLDDRTFMYEEERILYKHMMDAGELMLYNPNLIIYHKERATTSEVNHGNRERNRFLWENSLQSAYVLRGMFDEAKE